MDCSHVCGCLARSPSLCCADAGHASPERRAGRVISAQALPEVLQVCDRPVDEYAQLGGHEFTVDEDETARAFQSDLCLEHGLQAPLLQRLPDRALWQQSDAQTSFGGAATHFEVAAGKAHVDADEATSEQRPAVIGCRASTKADDAVVIDELFRRFPRGAARGSSSHVWMGRANRGERGLALARRRCRGRSLHAREASTRRIRLVTHLRANRSVVTSNVLATGLATWAMTLSSLSVIACSTTSRSDSNTAEMEGPGGDETSTPASEGGMDDESTPASDPTADEESRPTPMGSGASSMDDGSAGGASSASTNSSEATEDSPTSDGGSRPGAGGATTIGQGGSSASEDRDAGNRDAGSGVDGGRHAERDGSTDVAACPDDIGAVRHGGSCTAGTDCVGEDSTVPDDGLLCDCMQGRWECRWTQCPASCSGLGCPACPEGALPTGCTCEAEPPPPEQNVGSCFCSQR